MPGQFQGLCQPISARLLGMEFESQLVQRLPGAPEIRTKGFQRAVAIRQIDRPGLQFALEMPDMLFDFGHVRVPVRQRLAALLDVHPRHAQLIVSDRDVARALLQFPFEVAHVGGTVFEEPMLISHYAVELGFHLTKPGRLSFHRRQTLADRL